MLKQNSTAPAPQVPNAYVVIEFTVKGPKNRGTFPTERAARTVYDACAHGYLAAQVQLDVSRGAQAGQDTIWGIHK